MPRECMEALQGVGEVFHRSERLSSVEYAIEVWQEVIESGGDDGSATIRGQKSAHGVIRADAPTMQRLFRHRDLSLRLQDGREVDFFLEDTQGTMACSGPISELMHR
jgi:hypothetical protein